MIRIDVEQVETRLEQEYVENVYWKINNNGINPDDLLMEFENC